MLRVLVSHELILQAFTTGYVIKGEVIEGIPEGCKFVGTMPSFEPPDTVVFLFEDGENTMTDQNITIKDLK